MLLFISNVLRSSMGFVYDAILETILCSKNEVDSIQFEKEIEMLESVQASGMTGFQEMFKVGDTNLFYNEQTIMKRFYKKMTCIILETY